MRVWNHPYDADGNGYGGGNCDIQNAVEIGKRATQYGMKLLVDFHYSDFWADPGKQMVPLAWKDMNIEEKTQALYSYTKESLELLKNSGVNVGMVQVGNETNGKMCGETVWENICLLMNAGSKAIREIFPDAQVAVHFANPEKADNYRGYANNLDFYQVDYDVFASSYYPYWHGTLENLSGLLGGIAQQHNKKVMVAEVSYAYTLEDTDFSGNTISAGGDYETNYPYTIQGQANCVRDVVAAVASIPNGIGVFYWEGTWISVGQSSWEENSALWEKHGSGWASSYAAGYDPNDAGKYYGGCAVENQAMFDPNGKPLESLKIFNLVRYGNTLTPVVDALSDVDLNFDIGTPIILPKTVNAVMSDNSLSPVDITWNITPERLQAMSNGGAAKYTVTGASGGRTATAYITVEKFNYLKNPSFEDGDLTGWTIDERGNSKELYVEDKRTDSLGGQFHMHFWSPTSNSVDFSLEQSVAFLKSGTYEYSISIMGGDCGETEIYAYVKINGQIVGQQDLSITSYGNWDTANIGEISYTEGDDIVVGIFVKCQGSGSGAWGKIDAASLSLKL